LDKRATFQGARLLGIDTANNFSITQCPSVFQATGWGESFL